MRRILEGLGLVISLAVVGCVVDQPEHALPNGPVGAAGQGEGGEGGGGGSSNVTAGAAGTSSSSSTAGTPVTTMIPMDSGSQVAMEAGEIQADSGGSGDGGAAVVDRGQEYVWIDETFHWTTTTNTNVAKLGPQPNWYASNGIDYYNGKVEFRVTVTAKADATPVWHELCHWQNSLGDAAHVCLHCLPLYTKVGEYTCETTAAQQGGPVDYHKPFVAVQNRVKDGSAGRGTDLATLNKGLPIDYHYTVVIVPAGKAFSGWGAYPIK